MSLFNSVNYKENIAETLSKMGVPAPNHLYISRINSFLNTSHGQILHVDMDAGSYMVAIWTMYQLMESEERF